jgi:NAD(P)-dependent dehydrogenase (short-subunit alcohol dehydrogenase family)
MSSPRGTSVVASPDLQPVTPPVAVVTGGGSGIGRATVLQLLAAGFRVVVADINARTAEDTLALAASAGHDDDVVAAVVDVSQEEQVAAAVQQAVHRFGALTCMVNNAGVGGAFGPVTEVEVVDWDYTFGVLARGVFAGVKHAAKAMQTGGWSGSIVNVASVAGMVGGVGGQAYSAAKAAVLSLTQTAALELAPHRIRVNAVCPGVIGTPLVDRGCPEQFAARLAQAQPWPEAGRPEDVAAAIAFLAGDGSRFITGQSLVVDGGLLAAGPGEAFRRGLDLDPAALGLVGVSRGSTGQPSDVRRRLTDER